MDDADPRLERCSEPIYDPLRGSIPSTVNRNSVYTKICTGPTRKLLIFARKQRLSPAPLDVVRLLNDVGTMLRRTLGESIDLEIACPPDLPCVYADAGQLEGALVNLALNGRDAMPRGGSLRISADRRVDDGKGEAADAGYILFTVVDTGMGMSPEVLDHALEPFFTTKEAGKGSGLGLSMVYGFVKQSNGQLEIKSKLGYGTCVELHLPTAASPPRESQDTAAGAAYRGDGTILVVEDDSAVQDIAVRFLRSFGNGVRTAETAEAALESVRQNPDIVLVFSDVILGSGMNGVELAVELQRISPKIQILLTSGYEHYSEELDDDIASFPLLRKPYYRDQLADALRRIFEPDLAPPMHDLTTPHPAP